MRKLALAALCLVTAGSVAQPVSEAETNNRIAILAAQRNGAMDSVVVLQARVIALEDDLKRARAACPPPEAPK